MAILVCLMDGQRSLCFHAENSAAAEAFVDHCLRLLLEGKVGYVIRALFCFRGPPVVVGWWMAAILGPTRCISWNPITKEDGP